MLFNDENLEEHMSKVKGYNTRSHSLKVRICLGSQVGGESGVQFNLHLRNGVVLTRRP